MKIGRYAVGALMVLSLAACGGGGGGTSGTGTGTGSGGSATYTIGGTIAGLSASGLVLADNGGDNLTVSSGSTSFTFATALQSGAAYNVTVATQPTGETCTVSAGTGTATANVTSVSITCKALYTIGGTISGLSATGLVLANNGGDNLPVSSGATSFTFATPLQSGATYNVTVASQPTGETCTLASGTGTGTATGNVNSVGITCSVDTYTMSGTISGLTNPGLQLKDYAGGETLPVAANAASYQFTTPVPYGTSVGVTVATQPYWEMCSAGASNFSGPISANVTTDTFACAAAVASGAAVTSAVTFNHPSGVAVDSSGNIYVADTLNNQILEISPSGVLITTLLGPGAGLSGPEGVAVNSAGTLVYVADTGNNQILEYSGGVATKLVPSFSFNQPAGVAVDSSGNVFVADTGNNAIEEIPFSGGPVVHLGTSFTFNAPSGIAVDSSGNLYVADAGSSRVVEISGSTVTPLPGTYSNPFGVAVDSAGDVYVADNNDHVVQMITPAGNVTTVAGSTSATGLCSTTSPPLFHNPYGVAVSTAGDLYVSDYFASQVCKLTPGP